MANHVIITGYGPISIALVERLRHFRKDYVINISEVHQALDQMHQGYKFLVGELDDPETHHRAHRQGRPGGGGKR